MLFVCCVCFQTADKIFSSNIHLHSLLFINSTVESQTALMEKTRPVAKEFKGKVTVCVCVHVCVGECIFESKSVINRP